MSAERLVHDVHGHVITVRQVPQQVEDLVGHHAVLVVLGQPPDQLQEFLALFLAGVGPARLRQSNNRETTTEQRGVQRGSQVINPTSKRKNIATIIINCF